MGEHACIWIGDEHATALPEDSSMLIFMAFNLAPCKVVKLSQCEFQTQYIWY